MLTVKLLRTARGPTQLRLRMMYPQPDEKRFELYSWHSEPGDTASRSSSGALVCAGPPHSCAFGFSELKKCHVWRNVHFSVAGAATRSSDDFSFG